MCPDLAVLTQLLTDDAKVNYHGKSVQLKEDQASDSQITISQVPEDAVIIKCDKFPAPTEVLKGEYGECKRCDYIILLLYKGQKYALFIELKRGKKSEDHIIRQLKGGSCVLDYCRAVLEHFHEIKKPLGDYKFRYVCFTNTQINKKTVRLQRPKGRPSHTTPAKFLKVSRARREPLGALL